MAGMRISILDQAPIADTGSGGQALRNSLDLAVLADSLGFHRFWMAEHHATPALASASPELLLAALGTATRRIRLGSGGVMLPHYSPFKVAENFSMLSGLFPGRIDLGLGRAPGSDQLTAFALQQDRRQRAPNAFPEQLHELLGYFDASLPEEHPFRHLAATLPGGVEQPEIWLLGSSPDSAILAGALGLPYCIADFIAGEVPQLADLYRQHFRPSPRAAAPQLMLCCWLVASETAAEAERLAASARMLMVLLRQGRLIAVPDPETALAWVADHDGGAGGASRNTSRNTITGTAADCRAALLRKAELYGAGELMLVNILHDHQARLESYRLMAAALGDLLSSGTETTTGATQPGP